jgi:hypothetical protein
MNSKRLSWGLVILLALSTGWGQEPPLEAPPVPPPVPLEVDTPPPVSTEEEPVMEAPPQEMAPPVPVKPKLPPPPPSPPLPQALLLPPPGGPIMEYIGHRFAEEKGAGWGWVKREKEDWRQAKWVCVRETPGKVVAPWRALGNRTADQNTQYKLWGYFAAHRVYDPVLDEMNEVFVLDRFEIIGEAAVLKRKPGPVERFSKPARASRASSRENRPIQESN